MMKATKRITEGMDAFGRAIRQGGRSVLHDVKSVGEAVGRGRSGVRRSLRRLAKKSMRIGR